MTKRPLLTGAVFLALAIWFLHSVCGISFLPEEAETGKTYYLHGIFLRAEEKKGSEYLFLQKVRCEQAGEDAKEKACSFQSVLLVADMDCSESLQLRPGNEISVKVRCKGFQKARNEGNFDEESYYHSLGIQEKFYVQGDVSVTARKIYPVRYSMEWLKERLVLSVKSITGQSGDSHEGFFLAILTGDRSGLDENTKDLYRKSGIAHILAISGLHISLIGMSLFSFLRNRMRFSFAALISGAVMILFCLMCAESASAVRATIMFLIRLLALRFGKSFDLLSALGFTAIWLLLKNPLYLYNGGFLFSFCAVLGIGVLAPSLDKLLFTSGFLQRYPERSSKTAPGKALLIRILKSLLISLSVTAFMLPVIINSYYEVPAFSILLNLAVIPLMSLVLESGAFGVLCGLVSIFLGRFLIGAGVYLVSLIELLCAFSDMIPFSIVITGHWSGLKTVSFYAILFLIVFCAGKLFHSFRRADFRRIRKGKILRVLIFAGLMLTLCFFVCCNGVVRNVHISFFDVDQGDGILIESPSGMKYLIDGGSSSVSDLFRYRLESALKYKGISVIDYAIVTHTDYDHISGLLDLLDDSGAGCIRIRYLLLTEGPDHENREKLKLAAEQAGTEILSLHAGMKIEDEFFSLSCIHPDPSFHGDDSNGYSAVLLLQYQEFLALFTGDIGAGEERMLLDKQLLCDCDLLKVAHHGSRFSSSLAFLKAVSPEIAVVSAGVNNSYGHPHPDVLKRLENIGTDVYITAEQGEIQIDASPGGNMTVQTML